MLVKAKNRKSGRERKMDQGRNGQRTEHGMLAILALCKRSERLGKI